MSSVPGSMVELRTDDPDTRFAEVVNAWIDFNRGIGTIREQTTNGFNLTGVTPEQVPSELSF